MSDVISAHLTQAGRQKNQSRVDRLCGSICAVPVGLLLVIGSMALLGWNEKRAVYTSQTIDYARSEVVQLDDCSPVAQHNKKLIAFSGCEPTPVNSYKVTDEEYLAGVVSKVKGPLSVADEAIFSWERSTEEYVYDEEKNKDRDGRVTYKYYPKWVSHEEKYENKAKASPAAWPVGWASAKGVCPTVCIGSSNSTCSTSKASATWQLDATKAWDKSRILRLGSSQPLPLNQKVSVTTTLDVAAEVCSSQYLQTVTKSCVNPVAATSHRQGDYRFDWTLKVKREGYAVSGIALQTQTGSLFGLQEWQNPDHSGCSYCTIGIIADGTLSGDELLDELASVNTITTWLLRFVGWLLAWVALQMLVSPIAVAPELIPCVGNLIGGIVRSILCCMTCLVSAALSLLVIAIAWVAYRPMVALVLLAVLTLVLGAAFVLVRRNKKRNQHYAQPCHSGYEGV